MSGTPAALAELPAEPCESGDPFLAARLERAMRELRPEERLSLTLFYGPGFSPEEIADVLDCPAGTVKTHLHRGKKKLRRSLEELAHA